MSFEDLVKQAQHKWHDLHNSQKPLIYIGTATCGRSAGALEVLQTFQHELSRHHIDAHIIEVGCLGLCYAEPLVCIAKPGRPGICYANVTPDKVLNLIEEFLIKDNCLANQATGVLDAQPLDGIPPLFQTDVFKHQVRRILRRCGLIDPTNIDHYLARDGYSGLVTALQMRPEKVIEEVKMSGLRGRGGAGFPTWRKWLFSQQMSSTEKYVICNGSEGDPGTFSNKLLFESDPHAVLEGMLIAAYAIGASNGYVYCPSEYPLALERLRIAVRQMREYGLEGDHILDSSFNFHIKIKEGAGAYVCGEETALLECIEGRRGMPRLRPPFPPVSGLWNNPTIVNNVETLACVTEILQNGAEQFAQFGANENKGTKLFCISGNIKRSGVIEVPFGLTMREIIDDICGGAPDNKKIKAVAAGGPGGGCLPERLFDTPVDHDSLIAFGSSMGSGGIVVMDEDTSMVDIAHNSLEFVRNKSCGKCVPCRLGTAQLLAILEKISKGSGKAQDIDLLLELGEGIQKGSLCGLGQTAPNPMLSTIRYFREEYESHVNGSCPRGVCK